MAIPNFTDARKGWFRESPGGDSFAIIGEVKCRVWTEGKHYWLIVGRGHPDYHGFHTEVLRIGDEETVELAQEACEKAAEDMQRRCLICGALTFEHACSKCMPIWVECKDGMGIDHVRKVLKFVTDGKSIYDKE